MTKRFSYLCLTLGLCAYASCDEGVSALEESASEITSHEVTETFAPPAEPTVEAPVLPPVVVNEPVVKAAAPLVEKSFAPFTGKVKRQKVRLRANADLESKVIKELGRNDLLIVTGEKGDFYAVEAPAGMKAYVFRSFVLDGVVEGNRVNVRLEPSLDAPVIAHLNSGDRIQGVISSLNNKWYEITPPENAHFYVAKEYIESLGGPEVKVQLDKRKTAAEQLLDSAALMTKAEMQRPFVEMSLDRIKHNYEVVISDFADFPDLVDRAKEALTAVQEDYMQKRLSYLEVKAAGTAALDEAVAFENSHKVDMAVSPTDRMKLWEPVEENSYLSWASSHDDRSIDEFYEEQKQNAVVITGILENYTAPIKKKPGDFILRDKDLPVAYVYSTHVNLTDLVGKKVTLVASPRNNNNFAFPAYYVLSVE